MKMFKLLLMSSVFNFFQITAGDQAHAGNDDFKKDTIRMDENRGIRVSVSNPEVNNQIAYDNYITKSEPSIRQNARNLSEFYYNKFDDCRYVAAIRIDELLWPAPRGDRWIGKNGLILFGFKRPYYRFSPYPYVKGGVDLRLRRSIFGIENSGLITLVYDIESTNTCRRILTSISFERFSYNLTISFGRK